MKKYKEKNKKGFTLVELLAVIVILAIILVIAVPKVMSIIEDAKMGTLESTAKMIASGAEKQKVQNTVLGNNKEITCESVAKVNDSDYASCSIEFVDNTAKVTIEGKGKFDGLWVCAGTKTNATAQDESCVEPLQVKHRLFLAGEELTPDMFEVTLTENDGSKRILSNGIDTFADDSKAITITSPNWPNNYPPNMTKEENYWEYTFEGAQQIKITFDDTSDIGVFTSLDLCNKNECLTLYDSSYLSDYNIEGDYIKIAMESSDPTFSSKGFSATIKPMYSVPAEYTVSPNVAPSNVEDFDITINIINKGISKKITASTIHNAADYVKSSELFENALRNGILQTTAEYEGTTYDAGIRYVNYHDEVGNFVDVKNHVYYNCDDTDKNGVDYGKENYNYESSCEVWRIVGVFDTKSSKAGNIEKRIKLINTESTFEASWDSSEGTFKESYQEGIGTVTTECTGINCGIGINQWGESSYTDGSIYEGADLMRLLNGYYIGKEGATCTYCNEGGQASCSQTCDASSLKNANMKVLTMTAKNMIENAVWDTYAVYSEIWDVTSNIAYLQEKGISTKYTGKSECASCNDAVERTTSWTGLVGLMSLSDMYYTYYEGYGGWLSNYDSPSKYPWTITPFVRTDRASDVWNSYDGDADYYASNKYGVMPSVYLKSEVKVISGDGTSSNPYKLAL